MEKIIKPISGGIMFLVLLGLITLDVLLFINVESGINGLLAALLTLTIVLSFTGFVIVNPNESVVLILFGKYIGTVKDNGFFWVGLLRVKYILSLRARNLNGEKIKVNDGIGNPIEIAVVVVWRLKDTYKAKFVVDEYLKFVNTQSEAAVRSLAGKYPYDHFGDEHADITLRNSDIVNQFLEKELHERLELAGIEVIEARIMHLAYAPEIAGAMLQRQQASAVVSARFKIVEGAVGMVESALEKLSERGIVNLDEERKAAMVSNLLVVLCSDRAATPVVNAGTLYH